MTGKKSKDEKASDDDKVTVSKKATGVAEGITKLTKRYTLMADFFQVSMNGDQRDALPGWDSEKRRDFLMRRMRLIPTKYKDKGGNTVTGPGVPRGDVGHWFDADYKVIERAISGGELVGSRGPTLHESMTKAEGKKGDS
ncbi:MAG: hypothetical protein KGJ23_07720 [Euryarchaeota archaeon]|nr:hypothetical protein [Euryarchaeota archaeon]MDE1836487.1 hypothetical protein [Euryarchaeota archaeon]MDE1880248.1 hypothetical protein [Euryarchaeota archaeon]MDE2044693.1 hypothetical protein [Thermoplasmata archaeon]